MKARSTSTPPSIYFVVWGLLMLLLIASWGVAEIDLGIFNTILAMGIATAKFVLVLLFFRHVRYAQPITWLFVAAGFLWLLILISLTLMDYLTRTSASAG